ncbi:hypothetical protein [Nereida sp. MMG025]|uniref:hypothetical protein n=1 Tax=Nereida sp. MMG025 TaxID=2909981 RepID=UPI001F2289D6|nr:hypothetical protein [Nereida sp. MMG025]MCF6445554.1 hypothetical protein [Nereida sp. MMG025]
MKAKGLLAFVLVTPSQAVAQVCSTYRPNWTGLDGVVTPLGELGYFLFSPVGIGVIALTLLCVVRPSHLARFVTLILMAFAAFAQLEGIMGGPSIPALAYSEGCQGAPWVTLPVLAALAGVVLWRKPAPRVTSTDS